jgi:hypothetical protein
MTDMLAPLWKLDDELMALLNSVDVCEADLKPELEAKIAEYVQAEVQKVDKIAGLLCSLEAQQAAARTEIERLQERRRSAERASQRLESYILSVLRQRDGQPLRGRHTTFSTRRSEAVVIDDPAAVPDQYKRVTIVTDVPKTPIRDAIKSGMVVAGAHIETHENLVRK